MAVTDHVTGLVHEPTQTEGSGLDLTVSRVERLTEPGAVDFGGDELSPVTTQDIEPVKREPDDEYGWWSLDAGRYLLRYNESLRAERHPRLVLQTRDAVRARGGFHPTVLLDSDATLEPIPFDVGAPGIDLKENARVSTLFVD